MAIPDYQTAMLPTLKLISDNKEWARQDILGQATDLFNLTDEEKTKLLPSGRAPIIRNHISWALAYLKQASLVATPRRGLYKITERGLDVIKENPNKINIKYLEQFEEFREFRERKREENNSETESKADEYSDKTPDELLDATHKQINYETKLELLDLIKNGSPYFFEKLVVDLMLAIGYGGKIDDAGHVTQGGSDNGIDGIIKEDKLGLDTIYLQAKRWENQVSRPDIDKFIGALTRQKAKKGVFITTSQFSSNAHQATEGLDIKVVLIDGEKLTDLMIEYNLGVTTKETYEIKKIDTDYFIGES